MKDNGAIYKALRTFADTVTDKTSQVTAGEPEEQLRAPFETFMSNVAAALGWEVVCTGETPLPERLGRPDYAVHKSRLLAGYVELKAPGVGATASRFTGRNREQFNRFSSIPNILYTDGNEWALYRGGERVGKVVRLSGDVAADGGKAATSENALALDALLRDFLLWEPIIPRDRRGKVDFKGFAELLAPLCRMLRDDVTDALKDTDSPLVRLAEDWRQLLFPEASDEQFADAYAQTAAFALLLGRSEGADPLTLDSAEAALAEQHNLLSRALQVLTDPEARDEIAASLDLLLRVIAVVPPDTLGGPQDPWLYFYEDFLAAYDPELRKKAGVYYTPVEVVHAQTRLIDDLLVNRLNKPLGFADPGVVTLDPAVGTGTYLLGVIEHALGRVEAEQGAGAVAGQAATLAGNLYGFELMVGPYAVAELRVSRALNDHGASLPAEGTRIYLTDTLESPNAEPPQMPLILRPIAEQHEKALKVKSEVPVIVCLGNPPYERHEAVDTETEDNLSQYGGWVRFGDPLSDNVVKDKRGRDRELKTAKVRLERRQELSILKDFIDPAIDAGHGGDVKNIYNLYVYFWRWALWKVFEHDTAKGAGRRQLHQRVELSSKATPFAECASTCAASAMRYGFSTSAARDAERARTKTYSLYRRPWPLPWLSGRKRRTWTSPPMCITPALKVRERKNSPNSTRSRAWKRWNGGTARATGRLLSVPAGVGEYFDWPLLIDLMPWQHSGCTVETNLADWTRRGNT